MNVRYRVELSQAEREQLTGLLSGGKQPARRLKRAQILLAADAGASDEEIAVSVSVGGSTVYRTKRRFVEGNLEAALSEEPRPGRGAQAHRQGGGPPGGDRLFHAARGSGALDPGAAGRRDGQADRACGTCHARRCAGAWPRTTSSRGARTCGAFRGSTALTSTVKNPR